ncbi:bifunctional phosphoribosyl-AMP cyclohydrolase/phosphoribosyl-ATP diphosphatase HisIE [Ruthenibacterium lactatiformans]|jgi:phosphoribosyl-ATP pyrophosphohydrolase/phosphoribosyl-AMP cyclohydrolase|nr:bifunctional phosphoribosyl-AMP cyclohydrolase/phosphoribosyl-ATP diphosphatase HisIE [Ruthenibacterium lactatiformans]
MFPIVKKEKTAMTTQELKFDEKGLIPAVVQDFYTKKVLTVAYMNAESLDITLREKRTCFWSRSRQELWRKGETSGNVQHVVSVMADCDGDALVVEVIKDGPACHLGTDSCFANLLFRDEEVQRFSLEALYALLEGRNAQRPEGSYTTYLFEKGREKILKKVGEECTEVIIGAMKGSREETIYEISDLCYHVLVLMVAEGITLDDIRAELASRHVIDHKVKQETMQ